jgi:tRNA-splicing endonuclease subunit Sen54
MPKNPFSRPTFYSPGVSRPVIPKRGEKEFEPKPGGGSGLQVHILDASRNAMFEVLKAQRTISRSVASWSVNNGRWPICFSKSVSYAVWYPSIARAHVTVAKGIHFSTMGHSVPRPIVGEDEVQKFHKRLELLPEETLYLVERGSLFCWKNTDLDWSRVPGMENIPGPPMSVQQVYSELIGMDDLTLERFQVGCHGFVALNCAHCLDRSTRISSV